MYISKQIQYKIRKDLNENIDDSIETIFLEINQTIGKNIIIGVIYRPPNNKIELFENAIDNILSKIGKENKICYLMGDFNIDLLKSESCDYTSTIYNMSGRVVSDIQTRAEGESLYIRYNTDANAVNGLKNDSSYELIGKVILKINVVYKLYI